MFSEKKNYGMLKIKKNFNFEQKEKKFISIMYGYVNIGQKTIIES